MAVKYYYPITDEALDEWLDNFTTQLPLVASDLGIKNLEVNQVQALDADFKQSLNEAYIKEAEKRAAVGQKDSDKEALINYYRPLIQRIKNMPAYKEGVHGQLLRIVGAEQIIDKDNLKPKLKGTLDAGRPKIKWTKGPADALKIYVDRNDGQGLQFLTIDTEPYYIDTTPVPPTMDSVVWGYKGIYLIDDQEVGKYSHKISIAVTREINGEPQEVEIILITDQSTLQQVEIGISGTGNFIIHWGDNTTEPVILNGSSQFFNHEYAVPGNYEIKITGDISEITEVHSNSSRLISFLLPLIASNIREIILQNNLLSADMVNQLLMTVDSFGTSGGVISLIGNASPTGVGLTAMANLQARGWVVLVS